MGSRRLVGYGDAVVVLGGDRPGLVALDEALGGVLALVTGGVSETVLNVAGAQGRVLRVGREIFGRLREVLGAADRVGRTRRLAAAHAVLVVTAYFEALGEARLPFELSALRMTRREQLGVAGRPEAAARNFAHAVAAIAPPMPSPHLPHERALGDLRDWYGHLSQRLLTFIEGLAVWDGLDERARQETQDALAGPVVEAALDRYQELYARLATDVPEFGFWSGQTEHRATRAAVRHALTGVETLLAELSATARPVQVADALSAAYEAALTRPLLAEGDVPTGVDLPSVADGYLDPDFRVRPAGSGSPAEESWWQHAEVRGDLSEYLAGALTGPGAAEAPLVVLGQPGAGKSMLTKVLAARLPAAGFLPVRVVLREVPAEAEVQDQIEYAIRAATGERATWPDLVRAAPGRVPVVLFDGFDELLQATGVSQSDFLMRVAAFQQREADQGRPVIALVTTRTAVADRARYPEGSVALRLEPFSEEQVGAWLEMWHRTNARYFAATGSRPLPAAVVEQHRDLARQPLLLLMLALYDATDNALQRGDGPLEEADLYEDLLTAFATREVAKSAPGTRQEDVAADVERELQRLSLVAFGILNRRRQWVTAAELATDLTALLGGRPAAESGFRAPLDQADIALGRFFFVQRAQALRDDHPLATYEFLHATFGEYLAVRLAVQLLYGLLAQRPALVVGPATVDDDLMYALLSYVPLSSRQMLRFVHACVHRIPGPDRDRLADLVVRLMAAHGGRTQHAHAEYRPDRRPTSSRHGLYEANLVLMLLALTGGFPASRLFPESDDPPETWHRHVLLWRSAFTEEEWTGFALSLRLRHSWREAGGRELEVRPDLDPHGDQPVDPYWVFGNGPGSPDRALPSWNRTYWADLLHKADISGGTGDSLLRHALEPLVEVLGPALTRFVAPGDGTAASLAHEALRLWVKRRTTEGAVAVAEWWRCAVWLGFMPGTAAHPLVLELLAADAERLPPELVTAMLTAVERSVGVHPHTAEHMLSAAVTALVAEPASALHSDLVRIAQTAAGLYPASDARAWSGWVKIHDHDLTWAIYLDEPAALLREGVPENLPPALRHHVRRVAAAHYPGLALPPHPWRRPENPRTSGNPHEQ